MVVNRVGRVLNRPGEAGGGMPSSLPYQSYVDCETDNDCPKSVNMNYAIKCIDKKCDTIQIYPTSDSRE
ncbi:hypothetical protein P8452_42681 [Trifolium repens]|nr:hypothetical protein P8452_42681 [Trifolium repens]